MFGSSGCLYRIGMHPSWSEIKCILRRHEEMEEASREVLLQVLANLKDVEQTVVNLSNLVRTQAQWIDSLKIECQYLRSLVHPQRSFSISINKGSNVSHQGGVSDEEMGVRDPVPMEMEGNSSTSGEQDVQDNEFVQHWMFLRKVFLLGQYIKEFRSQYVWKFDRKMHVYLTLLAVGKSIGLEPNFVKKIDSAVCSSTATLY